LLFRAGCRSGGSHGYTHLSQGLMSKQQNMIRAARVYLRVSTDEQDLARQEGGTSRFVIWTAAVGTNGQQKPERCRKVY
jgi:hypothetical protein